MTTLPLAIRTKDDGPLVWLSDKEDEKVPSHRGRAREFHDYYISVAREDVSNAALQLFYRNAIGASRMEVLQFRQSAPTPALTGVRQGDANQSGFVVSNALVDDVIKYQLDNEKRGALSQRELLALKVEVSERVVEAIADVGYRWIERGQGAAHIATYDLSWELNWSDEEVSKILIYELNISIVSAARVFGRLFKEIMMELEVRPMHGDWGRLVIDGQALTLIPAE